MFDYTKTEIVTGVFVLLGLIGLGYLSVSIGGLHILPRDEYHVSARFSNVGDLKLRAPVKIAGVTIGRVEAIRLADYYGEADLSIARGVTLPKDTIASITPRDCWATRSSRCHRAAPTPTWPAAIASPTPSRP